MTTSNVTGKRKRKAGKTVPNISQRPTGSSLNGAAKAPTLPEQYVTQPARKLPSSQPRQTQTQAIPSQSQHGTHVSDFPPPRVLFPESNTLPPPLITRRSSPLLEENTTTPQSNSTPGVNQVEESPRQTSQAQSHHPSSEGHNFEDEASLLIPELHEDTQRALDALLRVPDRHKFVTLLSPDPKTPNSTW